VVFHAVIARFLRARVSKSAGKVFINQFRDEEAQYKRAADDQDEGEAIAISRNKSSSHPKGDRLVKQILFIADNAAPAQPWQA